MYCKQCGNFISNQNGYCSRCGCYIREVNSFGASYPYNTLIDKVKKGEIAALIGTLIPIINNISIVTVILVIFVKGPLNGDFNNLDYVNKYDLKEFAVSYGIIYGLTLIANLSTLTVMLIKTKQLSDFQMKLQTNYDSQAIDSFFAEFSLKPVVAVMVITAVLLSIFFAIPQIIIYSTLNNLKQFNKLHGSK